MGSAAPFEVRPARGPRELAAFIDFPYRHYASDPVWIPPLKHDIRLLLDRARNPFFEHAEVEFFLAWRQGRVIARVAAIHNRLHNEVHRDRVGFFGFFESPNEPEVARALLDTAAAWLKARGLDVLRGPASFSVNDECGLLVENFTDPPTLMMPYNPPWYVDLLEGAGLVKAKDLLVYQGGNEEHAVPVPDRLARATAMLQKRQGIEIRPLDMKRFPEEVESIKRLYNLAWEKNWGFVPMTAREIDHLAEQFKPVVIPELVPFAVKDGRVVGFGLALADLNVAFRGNRSGRMFPAALKVMWQLLAKRIRRARILLLGVEPDFRGKGIDAMLYQWIWEKGAARGITWAEAGWILEDNPAMNQALEKMDFRMYRKYRLYDRGI